MAPLSQPVSRPKAWPPLWRSAAWMVAGRAVSALCGFIQVPFVLAHLGEERFGLWITLTTLIWTLGMLDFGLGFAVQNRLVRCLSHGRDCEARAVWDWSVRNLTIRAMIVALTGFLIAWFSPLPAWLGFNPALHREVAHSIAVAALVVAIGLPLSLASRLAAARQQTWQTGMWMLIASICGLGTTWIAVALEWPLWALTIASGVFPIGLHGGVWLELRIRGVLPPRGESPAPRFIVSNLVREGLGIFFPQLASALAAVVTPLLVSVQAGPQALAGFGVLQRLFQLPLQVQGLSLLSLWPLFTKTIAEGDRHEARHLYHQSFLLSVGLFTLPILLILPWLVPGIIDLWLGSSAPTIALDFVWVMAAWTAAQSLAQPALAVLNAAHRTLSMAVFESGVVAASLAAAAWLGRDHGSTGVVLALAVPYTLILIPFWLNRLRFVWALDANRRVTPVS